MAAFLRGWVLLVISATLAGLLLIGNDARIAPPYGIDDWQQFMLTQAQVSALLAGILLAAPALLRRLVQRLLPTRPGLRLTVDLAVAVAWLLVVSEMAFEHRVNFGNTWTRLEFFSFYILTPRALLLGAALLTSARLIDNRWSRPSDH